MTGQQAMKVEGEDDDYPRNDRDPIAVESLVSENVRRLSHAVRTFTPRIEPGKFCGLREKLRTRSRA